MLTTFWNDTCYKFEYYIVLHVDVDIVQNSPYLKRRQKFVRGHRKIRRKAGMSATSGWLGVELVFAGLVMNGIL